MKMGGGEVEDGGFVLYSLFISLFTKKKKKK
jgi:hypothetical protein